MISLAPCHRCGSEHENYEAVSTINPEWTIWTWRCPRCGPLCAGHDREMGPHPVSGLPQCPDCLAGVPVPKKPTMAEKWKALAKREWLALRETRRGRK